MFDQIPPHFACQRHAVTTLIFQSLARKSNFSMQFEQGRIAGREEERNRIIKADREEFFSSMIAALFLIERRRANYKRRVTANRDRFRSTGHLTETTEKMPRRTQQCGRIFTIA